MEDKKVIARDYLSKTKVELQADGGWKALSYIGDRALYEGETEWVEETVEAMAFDDDPQKAIQVAMTSTLNYLTHNVYENGFKGLIEYREYERNLANAQANKPQIAQA